MTELADKKCDETQLSERPGIFQPLDYSFLNIKNVSDLTVCCPRIIPSSNSVIKKDINEKWVTRTLKINNNQIEDISTLPVVVHELFGDTSSLTWLDISCNNIPSIPNSFSSLKHLKIIYMHGNKIATLQEVIKLRQLPKLTKLTLHGNPIEKEKVMTYISSLKQLLLTMLFRFLEEHTSQLSLRHHQANYVAFGQVS
ncbi:Leucine-rich repeat-containing protein 51 [Schistosoma haematobium]|uniref:Leucine-rich repeat-containing protein 51 n=1 Tax=Schistosoma haematobium TaxID=6185 RepID=A0A922IQF1_SCHHA|nr:Leucine-rich repeat-containing protein 51 [Schistosoma haematobium]KAH9584876.1 Leucine-rich repeat-containing protein 51 [Schistosoma haematobium]CAH8508217.1 unnamed protein product [Schistosoma haematobium]CAH8510394.1 unnamed protein product [Schistosoma haematobium]